MRGGHRHQAALIVLCYTRPTVSKRKQAVGILDVILGRDQNGKPSKINMALIALMLWQLYKSMKSGDAQSAPAPAPHSGKGKSLPPTPAPEPSPGKPGGDIGDLLDAMTRDNATRPHSPGGAQGGGRDAGTGGGLGPLGDILGDILGGGRPGGGRAGPSGGGMGGGLGDILGDILGGGRSMPRAAAAPSGGSAGDLLGGLITGGGLGALLQQFEQSGRGDAAQSWVSRGGNIPLTPKDIESTFGAGTIETIAERLGMPRNELLQGLSEAMPGVIDSLTPDGRLPTPQEIARWT
jgi:uncharacterized protein YidB (DUF937 family)